MAGAGILPLGLHHLSSVVQQPDVILLELRYVYLVWSEAPHDGKLLERGEVDIPWLRQWHLPGIIAVKFGSVGANIVAKTCCQTLQCSAT